MLFFLSLFSDYLHDRNFVQLSDYAGKLLVKLHKLKFGKLKSHFISAEIKHLKIYLTVTFILTLIVLLLFFAINGTKIFRWIRRSLASMQNQGKKEKPVEPVTMANPNTESPKMRRHQNNNQNNLNRTSSIFTVTGTEYDQKTVSTPISRHPGEDTLTNSARTVDYSYDNKALQLTPVEGQKPRIESDF